MKHVSNILDFANAFWLILHDLSSVSFLLILLCMHNIVEFQVVPKFEPGEGVVAHVWSLRVLCATNHEFQIVLKLELGECVAAHACSLHVLHATDSSMWLY